MCAGEFICSLNCSAHAHFSFTNYQEIRVVNTVSLFDGSQAAAYAYFPFIFLTTFGALCVTPEYRASFQIGKVYLVGLPLKLNVLLCPAHSFAASRLITSMFL